MSVKDFGECADCKFWQRGLSREGTEGWCQRRAPRVLNAMSTGAWPITEEGDWCGEFEEKKGG